MSAIAHSSLLYRRSRVRPTSSALCILADVLGVECAFWLAVRLRLALQSWSSVRIGTEQYHSLSFALIMIPLAYAWTGLYPGYGVGAVRRFRDRVYSTTLIFGVLLAWNSLFASARWSRGILLGTMLFSLILTAVLDALVRKWMHKVGIGGMPVVVLGTRATASSLLTRLRSDAALGLKPVAVFDDDPETWGAEVEGVPVAGPLSMATSFAGHVECALVALPSLDRDQLLELLEDLKFTRIVVVPDLAGIQTLWTESRDLGGILGIELKNNLLLRKNRVVKRILDCAIAGPTLLLTLPLMALCALAIRLSSSGPVLYRQEREGSNGHTISVWKLRTMYVNSDQILREYLAKNKHEAEQWQRFFKLKNDPRVLPVIGTFLRATSIDELPQLWNVLCGQMSLVGPRPFPRYHLNSFPEQFRQLRRSVVPGLTGLWQVSDRSDGDVFVQQHLDTYYIRNWSLWLDLYILASTVKAVLFPKGAY